MTMGAKPIKTHYIGYFEGTYRQLFVGENNPAQGKMISGYWGDFWFAEEYTLEEATAMVKKLSARPGFPWDRLQIWGINDCVPATHRRKDLPGAPQDSLPPEPL